MQQKDDAIQFNRPLKQDLKLMFIVKIPWFLQKEKNDQFNSGISWDLHWYEQDQKNEIKGNRQKKK